MEGVEMILMLRSALQDANCLDCSNHMCDLSEKAKPGAKLCAIHRKIREALEKSYVAVPTDTHS